MATQPPAPPIRVAVIIPALNEERSLPRVLAVLAGAAARPLGRARRAADVVLSEVIVVDNGSTDGTAAVAAAGGATVVAEPRRGYGSACLRGLSRLAASPTDIVAFLDADFSDDPSRIVDLVMPIAGDEADLVIGSRLIGDADPGALLPQARAGNRLAVALIGLLYGHRYTDLGPFRAISRPALDKLRMRDPGFGWTAEMQVKAVLAGLRVREIPVPYRRRIGTSKITGTVSGSLKAGAKILWTIAWLRVTGIRALAGPAPR